MANAEEVTMVVAEEEETVDQVTML